MRRLGSDAATGEVVMALREVGIRPLLIKGPALERALYADGTQRRWGDIDLVVEAERFDETERVLSIRGFTRVLADAPHPGLPDDEHLWVRHSQEIDLHRGIWGLDADPQTVWETLTDGAQRITIGSVEVDVPAVPVTALLVAVHAAKHGTVAKPREDLRRALAQWDEDVWREAAAMAVRVAAQAPFGLGLEMLPTGHELRERLGIDLVESVDVRLRAQGVVPLAMGFQRLAATPTVKARAALLMEELLPAPQFMRWRYALARRGPAGLAAAYLIRLLTLVRQAPKGWHAWRRVK